MNKLFVSVLVASTFAILSGCATARMVETRPGKGGTVSVSPQNSAEARKKAEALMSSTCGSKKVVIVSEGEVEIGSVTTSNAEAAPVKTWYGATAVQANTKTETVKQTEWRINYSCE